MMESQTETWQHRRPAAASPPPASGRHNERGSRTEGTRERWEDSVKERSRRAHGGGAPPRFWRALIRGAVPLRPASQILPFPLSLLPKSQTPLSFSLSLSLSLSL